MALELDHIILAVDDLAAAMATLRAEGFTVVPGGTHASGATHNALIVFQDQTYIELLAPTGAEPRTDVAAPDFRSLLGRSGWAGYALRVNNARSLVKGLRRRDVAVGDPFEASRERPDGKTARWQMAMLEGTASPFFIQDITPLNLRIPDNKEATTHKNGVTGVISIGFVVADLETAIRRYSQLLGVLPSVNDSGAHFDLEGIWLTLMLPENDEMQAHLDQRGDAPYQLVLRSRDASLSGNTPARKVLGAQIEIARGVVTSRQWEE
ncbi:MAG: VOC family protein [Chloroflexota bacterium]|nr:MAG: hypothetical protein DIU68_10220 [Chloroflexota bacterium]